MPTTVYWGNRSADSPRGPCTLFNEYFYSVFNEPLPTLPCHSHVHTRNCQSTAVQRLCSLTVDIESVCRELSEIDTNILIVMFDFNSCLL